MNRQFLSWARLTVAILIALSGAPGIPALAAQPSQAAGAVVIQTTGLPTWKEQGPGPIVDAQGRFIGVGAIKAIAVHPTDAGIIYAATASGGVWRTQNAGPGNLSPTWQPLTDQFASLAMGAIAFSPLDTKTLYAGTGTFSSFPPSGPAVGLLKTTDGGQTWALLGGSTFQKQRITSVVPTSLSTANGQVVLAATIDSGGVYSSTDSGLNWNKVSAANGLPAGNASQVLADPANVNRFYAALPGQGIFRSDDGGQNWAAIHTSNLVLSSLMTSTISIKLAVHFNRAAQTTALYAGLITGTVAGADLGGMFRSTNQGGAWTAMDLPNRPGPGLHPLHFGLAKFSLAADPKNAAVVFTGGDEAGIWRGDASQPAGIGKQWSQVSRTPVTDGANVAPSAPHDDSHDLVFDPDGNLLEADDGGIYRLINPNADRRLGQPRRWFSISGNIRPDEPFSVGYDALNNLLYAGVADNGVSVQKSPASLTWVSFDGGDGGPQDVDSSVLTATWRYSEGNVFGCGLCDIVRRQYDRHNQLVATVPLTLASPKTPNVLQSGLAYSDNIGSGIFLLNAANSAKSRLLIGSTGLYESRDRGATATQLVIQDSNGITQTGVSALAYGGQLGGQDAPAVTYVGISSTLWLRTTETGAFTPLSAYTGTLPVDIALDPFDWRTAYVIDVDNVYQTTDAGANWTNITSNLRQITIDPQGAQRLVSVAVFDPSPAAGDEVVLVGALGGVFRTLNPAAGAQAVWSQFGLNLPNTYVQDLRYFPAVNTANGRRGDILVAGTYGRGMWTVSNASASLAQPAVLEVNGDHDFAGENDVIRLAMDANTPAYLDVFVNNTNPAPNVAVPLAAVQQIRINGLGGNDRLTIDSAVLSPNNPLNGLTNLSYDGGLGSDSIRLEADGDFVLQDTSLAASGLRPVALANVEQAILVGGASDNTFTVGGWSGGGQLSGQGGRDSVVAQRNADFVLSNGALLTPFGTVSFGLASIENARLKGGPSNNTFDVCGWTGSANIDGGGASDAVSCTANANFSLSNTALRLSNGVSVTLANIDNALLFGGAGDNSFDVSGWDRPGLVFINGFGGNDTLASANDTNFLMVNSTLTRDTGGEFRLTNVETAALSGGDHNNAFNIRDWPGSVLLDGRGGSNNASITRDASFTLANGNLVLSDGSTYGLANIQGVFLRGGPSTNVFDVSQYTGTAALDGQGGLDLLQSTNDADFKLSDGGLGRSSGGSLSLTNIEAASLTGGGSDNRFDVSGWTGRASLSGVAGRDTIVAAGNSDFVLGDAMLRRTGSGPVFLKSFENAELTGGASGNLFDVSGWHGAGLLNGQAGSDSVLSIGNADFELAHRELIRSDGARFGLTNIEQAVLTGGAGANQFKITDWEGQTVLDGQGGADSYFVATPVGAFSRAIHDGGSSGSDQLVVEGTGGADTIVISSSVLAVGPGSVQFSGLEALIVDAAGGDDVIQVTSKSPATSISLNGGDGNDTFTVEVTLFSAYSHLALDGGLPAGGAPGDQLDVVAAGKAVVRNQQPFARRPGLITVTYAGRPASIILYLAMEQVLTSP